MVMLNEVVRVGIADMNIVKEPMTIRTSGLGSCVGIVLYDETKKIAGYGTYHASGFQSWKVGSH